MTNMRGHRSYKAFLAVTVTMAAALAAVPVFSSNARAQTNFVVAANGNPFEAGWRKSLVPEFEKANNVKVIWSAGLSAQNLSKVIAQRQNPQIDIVLLDEGPFLQGVALDVWADVPKDKLGNLESILPMAFNSAGTKGVAYGVSGSGIYYNPKAFANDKLPPPTSWLDLTKPEFKNRLTMHTIDNNIGLSLLLALTRAGGGSVPDNMEPGFKLASQVAQNSITIDRAGDTVQLVQQGAAIVGTWSWSNAVARKNSGVDVEWAALKEGVVGNRLMAAVVKGRPTEMNELAVKFIALMLTPAQQKNNLEFNGQLPVSTKVSSETADIVTKMYFADQQVIAKNRPAWTERWMKEIERR